jgi:tRNA modification GTPase
MIRTDRTICAVATGTGGAISVIRVSGADSISIVSKIFHPSSKSSNILNCKGFSLLFGDIYDNGLIIDEVLVSIFRAPHSYTGENSVEISCHASSYIIKKILETLIDKSATLAQPGEFTQRAFMNGKMDLSQAEAVADVIASASEMSHKVAVSQMRGGFSAEIRKLREDLLNFVSLIELELDFGEEDVEFADRSELTVLIDELVAHITKLTASFSLGNAIKNGIPIAIVGHTNSGKSTLLNRLLGEERAIVSDIHGTTRDAIEDAVNINGIMFRFIDTAGLRSTSDEIEKLGIQITYSKIKQASVVLLMVDVTDDDRKIRSAVENILENIDSERQRLIVAVNKIDVTDSAATLASRLTQLQLPVVQEHIIPISAKHNKNIEQLTSALFGMINTQAIDTGETIIASARHCEVLQNALNALHRVKDGLAVNLSGDFLAQDIREVLHFIGSITGEISTDEILGNIFSKFCIGK